MSVRRSVWCVEDSAEDYNFEARYLRATGRELLREPICIEQRSQAASGAAAKQHMLRTSQAES